MSDGFHSLCPTVTGAELAVPASRGSLPPHMVALDTPELAQDLRPNGVNCTRSSVWRMRIKWGQHVSRPRMSTAAGLP